MTTEINKKTTEIDSTMTEQLNIDINMTEEIDAAPTDIIRMAERLLSKPDRLEERCREELEELDGPERWELCREAVRLTLRQGERTAYSASVLKSIIDGWTDAEYREMGVARE